MEDLLSLVCSPQSPWALLEGSSAEDRFLRQLAIRNPQMLKEDFLYSYFRSLQVVDKGVSSGSCVWATEGTEVTLGDHHLPALSDKTGCERGGGWG